MGYMPMGDVASSEFNATKYPGVCKPSTVSALATFKRLQTQLNRIAAAKSIPTIAIDGDIGPGTVTLFGKVQADLVAYATSTMNLAGSVKIAVVTSSCTALASVADIVGDVADQYATSIKAPLNPPSPTPTKPPTLVLPSGAEVPPPAGAGLLTAFTSASDTMKIAMIAVAGGVGYYLLKGRKHRRRTRRY